MKLNPSQEEAVSHKEGPMLVLAGPGSGKTLVITQRIKKLIQVHRVNPANILVITFTKAAANEMKERFYRSMERKNSPVTFGTFHAVFFQILKHAYGFHAGNIIREEQKYECMKQIISEMSLDYEDENEFIASILGEISLIKNTALDLEHYYSVHCAKEVFAKIYKEYHERLSKNRLIDFDDMLVYCYELFDQRKDILSAWQRKYQYILIDECQDINFVQFQIIKMLALPENNIFVVGDDDQSIYRFRGAKPEIMLGFEKSYPDVRQVLLNFNYRSRENIIKRAMNLISNNSDRYPKQIQAIHEKGKNVVFSLHESQVLENRAVIQKILDYKSSGGNYEDAAILFRTNTQPRLLMEQLLTYNIPFKTKDNIPNLYDHWIAKDIFTYIRIALGSRERRDFLRIMNRPKRYIRRESVDEATVAFDVWADYYYDIKQPWVAERIEQLEADLRVISRIAPYAAINYIRNGIGYEEYLTDYGNERNMKTEEFFDVLDELQDAAKQFKTFEDWFLHIEEYREELKRQKEELDSSTESVTLSTLHSAKGLEYDLVFIIGCNEDIIPYKKAVLPADLEEERRMLYVGMTRAKTELYMSASKKINGKEMETSRFIEEIYENNKGGER